MRNLVAKQWKFCIVGSGPAGFYCVSQLLKRFGQQVQVTVVERLPTPYGLIRSGVAPDHQETKNVINQFALLATDQRVRYMGNTHVGATISFHSLRSCFDAVIISHGAESSKILNIPGRSLKGVFSAREFVSWYNGHPDYTNLSIDLKQAKKVAILGLGNVALDCARILLQAPENLKRTDIAEHALSQLIESSVKQVDIIGRRGPAQAAFTAKEVREIVSMKNVEVFASSECLAKACVELEQPGASRARKRAVELLKAGCLPSESQFMPTLEERFGKLLTFRFCKSPVELLASTAGSVDGVKLEKTELQKIDGQTVATPIGDFEIQQADLVLESIGYRSNCIPGVPFDNIRGQIPNRHGKVLQDTSEDAAVVPGLYVCGWAKRGASGIIGTNLIDASQTVDSIFDDINHKKLEISGVGGADCLSKKLAANHARIFSFEDWLHIDAEEKRRGASSGRPRSKLTNVHEMLQLVSGTRGRLAGIVT